MEALLAFLNTFSDRTDREFRRPIELFEDLHDVNHICGKNDQHAYRLGSVQTAEI
jgi:hypothetical protein